MGETADEKKKDLPYDDALKTHTDVKANNQSDITTDNTTDNKSNTQSDDSDLPPIEQVEQFGFEAMKSVEDLNANDDEKDIDSSDKVVTGAVAEEITSNDSPESVGGT